MRKIILWSLLATSLMTMHARAQTVVFEAEQLTVSPVAVAAGKCVQLGLYMTYTDSSTQNYMQVTTTLDYTAPAGFLSGVPIIADYDQNTGLGLHDTNAGTAGGGDALSSSSGASSCGATGDILNGVTENGIAASTFMNGLTASGLTVASVDAGTGRVTLTVSHFTNDLFELVPGTKYLFAVLEFPLAAAQGTGQIDVDFVNDATVPDGNIINRTAGKVVANLTNGFIQVFDTVDCGDGAHYADFADVNGTNTGSTAAGASSMDINFFSPDYNGSTGNGGEMAVDVYFSGAVVGFQITGPGGFDTGQMATAALTSPHTLATNPTMDGSATSGDYIITYYVLGLDGNTWVSGSTCTMTVGWNAASCDLAWVNNGIGGANSTLTATLRNAMLTGGQFADIDVPNGAAGLADPIVIDGTNVPTSLSVVGNEVVAVFEVVDQSIPDATWATTYTLSNYASPDGLSTSDCTDVLGFVCPTNVTIDSMTSPADIDGTVTVTFSGDDVLTFDVIYNGVTYANETSPFDITAVGDALSVMVVGNGVGPTGNDCSDDDTATITFAAAVCGDVTLDPVPPADGYSVGDSINTIAVEITGASSVTIAGVSCTASADPDTNPTVTWTYPNAYTVLGPDSLAVVATNPNGVTTTCGNIVIDVDCTEANIISIAPAGGVGDIVIEGIAGLDYEIWYGPCGQAQFDIMNGFYVGDVMIGGQGIGTLANVNIVEDTCYYVVCPGEIIASNSLIRTVPTLGEWGTAIFVVLVMFAGLVILRRKN